uniref:Uncharacterized protein n=1 Tax=Anopheles arabiensis TaxID=7173 RepID=A0A182IFY4_ANOAR
MKITQSALLQNTRLRRRSNKMRDTTASASGRCIILRNFDDLHENNSLHELVSTSVYPTI